jgi:eukaryotic-like serine/threonine-protein kinase
VSSEAAKSQDLMSPERWARVRELICEALDRHPSERAKYLENACGNDSELRSQVESLMAVSESSGGMLPSSMIPARRLAPGTVIDHFEIGSLLGVGGMGEVYRARDQQLKRDVAIKLLPAGLCLNRERQRRFEQEARAAAALSHPNILAIYQLGWHESQPYIVAELLEGQTLREALKHGAMSAPKVIDYGLQMAQGLALAHDKGIIHRDLKPENIFITKTGQVKILDFGLAKLRPGADDETRTNPDTDAGVVLGTLAYMSPEQVRGQAVDQRSDMFSLGAILYEILTRRRAFEGKTAADFAAAILHEEPKPLRELAPSVPWELERVIARCLRKDPERRLRSMADLAVALAELKEESDSGKLATAPVRQSKRRPVAVWVVAVLIGVAVLATWIWIRTHRPQKTVFNVVPITTYPGFEKDPSLSPDGSQIAFSWNGPTQQRFHIYVKAIGPGPPLQLTNTAANDGVPAWSPDAGSIAFLRDFGAGHYKVVVIPALGGPERNLTEVLISEMGLSGPYLSWTPDSRSLVVAHQTRADLPAALFLLDVQSGERHQVTSPPPGILGDGCTAVSPDGQTLAFCRCAQVGDWLTDLYTVPLSDGAAMGREVRQLTSGRYRITGLTWNSESNRLVFSSAREDGSLGFWTVAVPNRSAGAATELQLGSGVWPTIARRAPRLAFLRMQAGGQNIWRSGLHDHGRTVEKPAPLIASTRADFAPQYSPDGRRIAFESSRGGNLQIWTCDSQGENCLQVTSMNSEFTGTPSWSPDGNKLAFYSRVSDKSQIFVIGADGLGLRQLTPGDANYFFPRWSRNGEWIYCSSNRTGAAQIWKFPLRDGAPIQVTRNGGFAALESPNGKTLYYTKMQATDSSLWKLSLDTHEETQVLPSILMHNFDVVNDGIYFEDGGSKLKFLETVHGTTTTLTQLPEGYVGLSVSPDRKSIVFTHSNPSSSELMLVDNFNE